MLSYDSRGEQGAACGQLESFMLEHNGRFNSRDYDKFERIELMESPVRDAIANLKSIPSKRSRNASIYAFLGAVSAFLRVLIAKTELYYFTLSYIPRALNNRDANDTIVQMLLSESGASTSFYYGLNRKILTTTATTLTTYLGDKPIDSHRLIASGFLKVVMQETEVKIFLDNERQNIIELWIKPTF